MSVSKRPFVLTIMDGWGYRADSTANAIAQAKTPNYDRLLREFPHTLIQASDHYVGLPDGQMGNSEVGHLNIGAGRVVQMDITRIEAALASGAFEQDPLIVKAVEKAGRGGRSLHLFGLVSDGGVHSHNGHIYGMLRVAKKLGLERVYVHAFLDGRDTPPASGAQYLEELEQQMREIGAGQIATVSGRYYAMDRDKRWERVKKSFDAMVHGQGEGGTATNAVAKLKQSYNNDVTDEFVLPYVVVDGAGKPLGMIQDGDVCINFNFRADRAREITRALTRQSGLAEAGKNVAGWESLDETIPVSECPRDLTYLCMTQYDVLFGLPVIFQPESHKNILADMLAGANLRNLRVAETEKFAHVTFFFNGGVEEPFPGEDRILIPSMKVATYDLAPEMRAKEVGDEVIKAIHDNAFDVIVCNFANCDMVGHSGKMEPTIRAVEAVDTHVGRVIEALKAKNGSMLLTADHGNAEQMVDPITGAPHTAHTTNPVPLLYIAEDAAKFKLRADGSLRDLSPTMLSMMGLGLPKEMTGGDLRVPLIG